MTRTELESFCSRELGSGLLEEEFVATGVGTVFGLRLRDGRRVAVKLYRADTDVPRLDAALTVQRRLAEQGFPAPLALTGAIRAPEGVFVAETLLDRGAPDDPHNPLVRRAMASALSQLVELCRPLKGPKELAWSLDPTGPLWGKPHDDLFDFEATSAGAEWIDVLAREARGQLDSGPIVVSTTRCGQCAQLWSTQWPTRPAASMPTQRCLGERKEARALSFVRTAASCSTVRLARVRLCMFTPIAQEVRGWPGRIEGDRVIQLAAQTLESFFTGGGQAREHAEFPLDEVRFLAPVRRPPSVRDFYAFEQHVKNARSVTGRGEVPREWYEIPAFYFSNPAAIYGPDDEIPYPEGTQKLDYELEVAVVIGADGEIGGFTVMNDWSARDLQRQEMAVGLGPAKGKDFATSLGPVVVTPDELGDLRLEMVARVNGEERSRGNLGDMYHSWEQILAHAARNTELRPGDVIGSGTVGTGCILEHGDERWLQPGDEVELEVEGIGILRNPIG